MDRLSKHYAELLGLAEGWEVERVDLSLEESRVEIRLRRSTAAVVCPECSKECSIADHAAERTWRHLDTMQFETRLIATLPRAKCADCGVKTVAVPWSEKYSRFTLMFEAFAIRVIQAAANLKASAALLGLDWSSVQRIMERAVERGLLQRELDNVTRVGIDEKSFRRGQDYVSVMTDPDESRVLEVSEGRDEKAADILWNMFSEGQRQQIEAVSMDMWKAFENSAEKNVPDAEIVHDRYHISAHLNAAVDKVRRSENKALRQQGDDRLKGSRNLWLYNEENISDERRPEFEPLKNAELKTSRAWALKEQFRWFWEYHYPGNAEKFFNSWYAWASRCRLEPMKKVARMLKNRLPRILTWFCHRISNATAEGFNSRIQSTKASARGFRNFTNYRIRILFYCGKLDLVPHGIQP